MKINLSNIELDTGIQCRAAIDAGTVDEYAERMTEYPEDKFPPVELYGTVGRAWIADGWHRVLAAKQVGFVDIEANIHPGGRMDALKVALGANASNGLRRTNADKRRAVEIACREFSQLSSRQIADLCGVSADMVIAHRPALSESDNATRTTKDGREYPATRPAKEHADQPAEDPDDIPGFREVDCAPTADTVDPTDDGRAPRSTETYTSETMAGLKRYWGRATKKERKAFMEWVRDEN